MNYRAYLVALAAAAASFNASAFGNFALIADDADPAPADSTAFVFTDVITIPTTSVKDQNKSGTCWCFAGTSMFEDEIVRRGGKPLDLSEMFTVRQCYLEKADRYVRLYGETNFAAGGSIMDVPMYGRNTALCLKVSIPALLTERRNMCTANSTPFSRHISTLW